jgi:short subunit dehydrogenase-like uncharacterized protein
VTRLDLVIWGATGFTGGLVAEYLARTEGASGKVKWGIAGRRQEALEAVRQRLVAIDPTASTLPLITADASSPDSLRAMAAQARVVCTTVGPYAQHGSALVAACIAEGSDCCDLSGEPHWMREMMDRHQAEAEQKRVRIVHSCGFDSIPSDLGTFLVEQRAIEKLGRPLPRVTTYVKRVRGASSGGTIASIGQIFEAAAKDRATRKILADPYSLLPEGAERGPRTSDVAPTAFDAEEQVWTAPFLMAPSNGKIVRRTNALLGYPYGRDFLYREVSAYKIGPKGFTRAAAMTAGLGALSAAMTFRPARQALVGRVLPAPGEGPNAEVREKGLFEFHVVGRDEGVTIRVIVRGDKDPGYGSSAGMLGESALCLALDPLAERFGMLTPASAMGRALVDRLPRAGVTFEVEGP